MRDEENVMSEEQISEVRASVQPVDLAEVDVPDSDDEDAQQDLALRRKIYLENGRRIARRNQRRGRRMVDVIQGMDKRRMEEMSVMDLMEMAEDGEEGAEEGVEQVRQNASLTPLRSSSAANAEAALRSNERRGRLALIKAVDQVKVPPLMAPQPEITHENRNP